MGDFGTNTTLETLRREISPGQPDFGKNMMETVPQVITLVALARRSIPECDTKDCTQVLSLACRAHLWN